MRNFSNLTLTAILTATTALAMPAYAQENPTIYTGGTGGAYYNNFGPVAADILGDSPSQEVIEAGVLGDPDAPNLVFINYTLTNTAGTGENMERVKAEPTLDLGVGQFNEVALDTEGLWFVDTGAKECLFGVTSNANIANAANLNPRVPFGLPGVKSGSTSTFMRLEPFASMRNVTYFEGDNATGDMISAVNSGGLPAAGFVQLPDTTNSVFEAASELDFFGVINRQMLRQEVGGTKVWTGVPDITVSPGSWTQIFGTGGEAKTVTTACTPVVFFGTDPALLTGYDAEDMTLIRDTLQRAADAGLLVPDTGDWRTMFADMAERAANATASVEAFIDEHTN